MPPKQDRQINNTDTENYHKYKVRQKYTWKDYKEVSVLK